VSRRAQLLLAAGLLSVLAFTGAVGVQRMGRQLAVARACEAVAHERVEEALLLSDGLAGADPDGRLAAECRCRALAAAGRMEACAELLDGLLRLPEAAAWIPAPDLSAAVVRLRRARGEPERAADLARRAAAAHPEDGPLHQLEIATRGPREGEAAVLAELEARLDPGAGPQLGLRLALAISHSRRQEPARVAAVLGEQPPPAGHPYQTFWFQARAWALAALGDLDGLRAGYEQWRELGGDPVAIEADYALQLSIAQLPDPERDWISLLRAALEHEEALRDPKVPAALYLRLVGHLMVAGRYDEALRVFDRASARYELAGITREQIVQRRLVAALDPAARAAVHGTLVFQLPPEAPAGSLWVSPGSEAEPDADFERHALAPGVPLRVERGVRVTPERWVFQDAAGLVRASGSAWPVIGSEVAVRVEPGPPVAPRAFERSERAADGRRRVFVVLPDCADWRLVQYLRARGELPVLEALLASGFRAVLTSDPPLTAAAMEKLVWPERGREVSFLGELNRLGLELGGLASIGRNPLGFLSAVLPESRSLFEVVGAGPHVAANLLFSHGGIDAGHNAAWTGPHGARRDGPRLAAWRELTEAERAEWPDARSERAREHARTIAAELDAALELARAGEVDLLLLRVEPLDLLTHELFGELTATRQDDGRSGLLDAYRHLDRRIGELWNALDADDVLVVLSDHGIKTALEHESDAIFVAAGAGIAPGRAPGRPEIAGVPHALAALFGQETAWPDTGLAIVPPAGAEVAGR